MRPRVHTEKHIVQSALFAVASGALTTVTFLIGKQNPTTTNATHVKEGATVSAVFIEMWITSDDAAQGSAIVTLERRPSGLIAMTAADSAALNAYDNKKNIFHTFQGLVGPNVQPAMPAIRGWFKIPKGKQRFGTEDILCLNVHGQSNGLAACGFFTYKEQY